MSHSHDHGDHAHDHDHGHAHPNTGGPSDNVFIYIDRDNVIALNSIGEAKQVINPWDERVVSICASIRRQPVLQLLVTVYPVRRRRSVVGHRFLCLLPVALSTDEQYHTRPVHWVCEAALALAQIWTWRTDACQSSSRATFHSTNDKGHFPTLPLANTLIQFANIDNLSTFRIPKTSNLWSNSTSPLDAKSGSTRKSKQLHVSSVHFYVTQLSFLVGPRNSLMCLP